MDRSTFAEVLKRAVIAGWREFRERHADETPYALALVGSAGSGWLGYAVATEERLQRIAADYEGRGYRYQGWDWEDFDNRERLAAWLRWSNPDDGWRLNEFSERFEVASGLNDLLKTGALGEDGEDLEEFCTDALASICHAPEWRGVVVGFTYGEDPRDYLRTATRVNRYRTVLRLWREFRRAEELGTRIASSRELSPGPATPPNPATRKDGPACRQSHGEPGSAC
jgi:hypothetical protein